jgi:hypothetical protein
VDTSNICDLSIEYCCRFGDSLCWDMRRRGSMGLHSDVPPEALKPALSAARGPLVSALGATFARKKHRRNTLRVHRDKRRTCKY